MMQDSIDFGTMNIPKLFRMMFIPTLLGMSFPPLLISPMEYS